ncbi:unnamed protein product, partial [Allacma fusca]
TSVFPGYKKRIYLSICFIRRSDMGKFRGRKGTTPPLSAQIFSAFVFAGAIALASATDFSGQPNNGVSTVPDLSNPAATSSFPQVHARWKRSLTGDLLDTADQLGIGGSYLRKFKALLEGTPPTVREAFLEGDFSNVTESDIRGMNVSVLEYVPPKLFDKMTKSTAGMALLTPIIEKFLDFNRPNALGRLMSVAGDKLDANTLLSKVKEHGGDSDQKNEAASVLLYNALNKLGDSNQITTTNLRGLLNDNLLQLVPEEQLMKVKDKGAAKFLLNRYYAKASGTEHDDVDDKALIYQLANAAYGKAEGWTTETISELSKTPQILSQLPSAALKNLSPDVVSQSISNLRNIKFENPLQGKSIAEAFLEKSGFKKDEEGQMSSGGDSSQNLGQVISSLGNLAAFVNPSMTDSPSILGTIINSCDQLNLPAPFEAVKNFIKSKSGGKKLENMEVGDIKDIGISVLKNGPPELMNTAMSTGALSTDDLKDIGNVRSDSGGIFNSFMKGLISQVAAYAVRQFTKTGGGVDFSNLPGAFMGALGLRGLNNVNNRELDDLAEQLKKNPDSLDDAQKALLLKKFKDAGLLDDVKKLPPEIRALLPRKQEYDLPDGILDGLPSDSELRLAHGNGKKITAALLAQDSSLVGTLTPKQVNEIDISEIPAVLAAVRKSKDGPQPQALKALSQRFKEYIQLKSEDYETPDKKLLKHITAAEVSKLPATVLAYFVDPRQTGKLPADVRKEILIALGELSTKDHASIPAKTREEIILQGLRAIDEKLDGEKKLGVPELAAIGGGVVDLPPDKIDKLTPVALEQALEIVQGTADDDDDGLKLRPCLNPQQKKAWRDKIEKTYGPLTTWDPATVTSLCCSLALFEDDDLHSIPKDTILSCRCPSDEEPPSHLKEMKKSLYASCKHDVGVDQQAHKFAMEKVKTEADFDLSDLESQIIRRRKRESDDAPLNCYAVRIIGSTKPFDKERLESIEDKDIHNCLYELGKDPLSTDVAKSLWEKLLRNKDGLENLAPTDYMFAGHILSGIRQEDVPKLDLSDPDVVSAFGEPLGLSKSMLEKLAHHLEDKQGKTLDEFSSSDLISAKNILCGYSHEKLIQIKSEAFLEALPVLKGSIDKSCELNRLNALAGISVRPDVLGDTRNWTSADVRGVGVLINGIQDITRIPPEAFLGVTSSIAESFTDNILTNLSPEQTGYLPRFSAQSLTEEQISLLSADAHHALDLQGPLVTDAATMNVNRSAVTCYSLAFIAILASRFL